MRKEELLETLTHTGIPPEHCPPSEEVSPGNFITNIDENNPYARLLMSASFLHAELEFVLQDVLDDVDLTQKDLRRVKYQMQSYYSLHIKSLIEHGDEEEARELEKDRELKLRKLEEIKEKQ